MKNKIFLIAVFCLALFIRIYNYQYPPLLWDEAALGYNAYSLLTTGKDEYGQTFPLIFKSFNDYKPGLYVYLTLPFVKLFGLNELAVRLPSILIGSLIPIGLYFLILAINPQNRRLAAIAALLVVLNPFNIHYSRGAWETNILTGEMILAAYLFLKNKYFWSSITIAAMLYTYQGGKLMALILIFILLINQISNLTQLKEWLYRHFFNFIFPLIILALPVIFGLLFKSEANRLRVASLFSYPRSAQETQQIIAEGGQVDFNLFHNQFIYFLRNSLLRYFNHFSPEFLTFVGDWQNPRHSSPYTGVLLLPSIIFLIIGLLNYRKKDLFFLLWLLLAPLASALTRDSVSATRAMSFSIPLIYFTAAGILIFLRRFPYFTVYCLLITAYLLSFIYWADLYFNHMTKTHPSDWLVGYKEAMVYIIQKQDQYQTVTFTDFYGQPYIYYLFYSKYPPAKYQQQAQLISSSPDVGQIKKIDKINFGPANFPPVNNSLTVFSYDEIIRQNLDFKNFTRFGNFYAYENP